MLIFCRKLHNWLGLLLAVQITLWFLSGLVMAILPIEQVRGEHLRLNISADWHHAQVSPAELLQQHSNAANLSLSQHLSLQQQKLTVLPVYVVAEQDQLFRYSAINGALLPPLTETQIRQVALAQYQGTGQLQSTELLLTLPQEVQQLHAPLWLVRFDDQDNSRFYLDPASGAISRVRTDSWRLFDFFWMLHIMDYQERSNFNTPLLIGFSGSALFFSLTGFVLLWQRFRPRKALPRP
ncbi:PepSY domain-containing protein [Alishewanella sp. 16-MA]|uniref:PepSY domain-containing protein n=1 Tax=Alishewanella maricola TaxID=2795740 RepID=A0ABS8C6J1_9ALTE|nr:PepSY domain-containing protein [Alishewanella maricola]MCB5227902.1 PepSY domain-containing protein [Alishewanella maricola]